ncbi:MAG: ATPase, T2SS/T4P/T4SS family [Thermodesulfobacteriota bacterium]
MLPAVIYPNTEKLGAILIRHGKLQENQLERALAHQASVPRRLGEILISLGFISEDDLLAALAEQLHLPVYEAGPEDAFLPLPVSQLFLREHPFALFRRGEETILVLSDPLDSDVISAAEVLARQPFTLQLLPEPALVKVVDEGYGVSLHELEEAGYTASESDIDRLKDMASEAPVIKYVNNLIDAAINRRASDIHMEPFEDGLLIRLRIDGILYDYEIPPLAMQPAIISRTKLLAGLDIAERRLPQDGKISLRISGREVDLRVATVPTVWGEGVVIRILEKGSIILQMSSLGMGPGIETEFRRLIAAPHGIILVTGPTGSGKTTTLYCALNHINSGDNKIITIEDPVEYQLKGINQIQVRPEIGLTFAKGLRSIVRQDPDVIMIGEIRDLETAEIAVQSSLTGHLVFSTLHTNDATSAVMRMMDLGIESFLISSSLLGVLAQRLVRRICPHCARDRGLASDLLGGMPEGGDFVIREGAGCPRCSKTGYSGRVGLYELLTISDALRRGISKGADLVALMDIALASGFKTMFHDGMAKVREGLTSYAEVVRVTQAEAYGTV